MSIPPGGMEELDTEVFMGVVNKHITEVGLVAVKLNKRPTALMLRKEGDFKYSPATKCH